MNFKKVKIMQKSKIIYTEKQEIIRYLPKHRDTVNYKGILKITDKKTNPVTLALKIIMHNFVFQFPEKKILKEIQLLMFTENSQICFQNMVLFLSMPNNY